MNIFNVYTRKTLRLNRTRTIVTIIGIMLSVALFTAVTEGAASGREYMIRVAQEQTGSFSAFYTDMDSAEYTDLQGDTEVAAYTAMDEVGYADIGSTNEAKPYLCIEAVPADFAELVSVRLTAGTMPENDTEILLPSHLYSNGGVKYALGDELTLDVGERTWEGETLTQDNPYTEGEALTGTRTKTYTVVGFYERFDYLIEDYNSPGYTALTGGAGTGSYTVFFSLIHPGSTYKYLDASGRDAGWQTNSDLLNYYGTSTNSYLMAVMYGLIAILLGLILFGSVALIYNAFSISVSERTKQFGLLKSIGATNRQIMHTVLYEALVLCAVAIPLGLLVGCAGIGITLYALRDTFAAVLDNGTEVKMQLVLNAPALVTAGVVGLVTALISAWIPARRAVRIDAIDAIRQSRDISIGRRQVKTSRLTAKLFGFEGMLAAKNFKRSRRQYRSTVVSMFLSVVLFISASSFCAYLTDSVDTAVDEPAYDILYYTGSKSSAETEALYQNLLSAGGVTSGTYCDESSLTVRVSSDMLTEEYTNPELGYTVGSGDDQLIYAYAYFVQDDTFRQLLKENGLDEEAYFSADEPLALMYDHSTVSLYDDAGSRWYSYSTLRKQEMPFVLEYTEAEDIEGYDFSHNFTDDNGSTMYAYIDEKALDSGEVDDGDWLYMPAEEVESRTELTVGAVLDESPYFGGSGVVLLYPYSMEETVLGMKLEDTSFYFTASDHSKAYNNMLTILNGSGRSTAELYDMAASGESNRALITVINVFSYGFIILISLIAVANVFNTISTNIALRRREFAMLRSVGMTQRGFGRMMNYECLLYGFKGLLYGLPASFGVTWLIYQAVRSGFDADYYVPWISVVIAAGSVFLVVFTTIVYSMGKIKKDNPIDALKNENL